MIRCGLDWSGDSGLQSRGGSARLSIALVLVDDEGLEVLDSTLDDVRHEQRLRQDYVFKYASTRDPLRSAFLSGLARVPFRAYVRVIEKDVAWESRWTKQDGGHRLRAELRDAVMESLGGESGSCILLVDLPRAHSKDIQLLSQALRRSLPPTTSVKVKPCPDTQVGLGNLIQTADMLAGWLSTGSRVDRLATSNVRGRVRLLP